MRMREEYKWRFNIIGIIIKRSAEELNIIHVHDVTHYEDQFVIQILQVSVFALACFPLLKQRIPQLALMDACCNTPSVAEIL